MVFTRRLASGYLISDRKAALDLDLIHRFLSTESYWAQNRPREITEAAIAGSLCLGLYAPDGSQCGFSRVVTDRATMAHLSDVFVLASHRGHGLGEAMVKALLEHPALSRVRRWTLSTADAHGLYAKFGFAPFYEPEKQMIRMAPINNNP
jgi:GNAT superfamily N-acetyltransferase